MGLFIGFSFISLVEIFYYAVIKPFSSIKRQHKREKKAAPTNTKVMKCLTFFRLLLLYVLILVLEEN